MLHWWTKTLLHTTFATLSYGYIRGSYVHYNTVYTSVSIMLQLLKTLGLQLLTLPLESSSGSTQSMSVYIIDDPEPETSKEFTAGAYLAMNTHTHTHTHTHRANLCMVAPLATIIISNYALYFRVALSGS